MLTGGKHLVDGTTRSHVLAARCFACAQHDIEYPYISESIAKMLYYVYIMTNVSRTLYIGVTNDLERRVYEHKYKVMPGFTERYNITRLVYFEETPDVNSAIAREKQLKGWRRNKKIALIEAQNPTWEDIAASWFEK